jgi:hypothetical protein
MTTTIIDTEKAERDAGKVEDATAKALAVREKARRKSDPTSARRLERISAAIDRIDRTMKPLRSHIGRLAYAECPKRLEQRIRAASSAAQHERKQLKKMLR